MAPAIRSRRKRAGGLRKKITSKVRAAAGRLKKAARGRLKKVVRRRKARRLPAPPALAPRPALSALSEEQQIESSKYLPAGAADRVFEEERFVFPESYGRNRVRLLVKDPEWLFAHWDVDARVLTALRQDLGGRAVALSRLTLRVADAAQGGATVILLPRGARGWYVRSDGTARTYRAQLGLTLPSGEFRALAESNVVRTPRVGPSEQPARARVRFRTDGGHVQEASRAFDSLREPGPLAAAGTQGSGERVEAKAGTAGRRDAGGRHGASDEYRR